MTITPRQGLLGDDLQISSAERAQIEVVLPADRPRAHRPEWLLSDFDAPVWVFNHLLPGVPKAANRLRWDYPAGAGQLTDPRCAVWLEACKQATWWYKEQPDSKADQTSSVVNIAKELRIIAAWCIDKGIDRPSKITADDFTVYQNHIKELKITNSTVEGKLIAFRQLWLLRAYLPDALNFDPLPGRGDLQLVVKSLGIPDGHTKTLRPDTVFALFDVCLKWIEKAAAVSELRDTYIRSRNEKLHLSVSTRSRYLSLEFSHVMTIEWPTNPPVHASANVRISWAINCTYAAAIILLLGFVALRKHELASLDIDCVEPKGDIHVIRGRVRKTSPTPTGTATERPIHPIAISAIEAIKTLSSSHRPPGDKRLLIRDPLVSKSSLESQVTRNIYSAFDALIGSDSSQFGGLIRPHMLRRAFCMLYVWRFELGDLETLRRHLYHKDVRHTLRYCTDDEISEFLPQSVRELSYAILSQSLMGSRTIHGGYGSFINRLAVKIRSLVKVLSLDRLQKFVGRMVDTQGIRLHAHPHGYCVRSAARDRHAKCTTDGRGPDWEARTDVDCAVCPNFAVHIGFAPHWEHQRRMHQAILDDPASPSVLVAAATRGIAACDRILAQLELDVS